ncbi:hypothetical protein AB0K43_16215 [Kitasatospora sp. NPDC049258]|uniref:hypothetical protein n=1 Tax=Kitasatospora sp. NPDC049258 TaxID=3155394 RepID=UPI00343F0EFA
MAVNRLSGSPIRRTLTRAALVCTAAAAALGLAGTDAMADSAAATFTLGQGDWWAGSSVSSSNTHLDFQSDGNLVLYANSGRVLWASGTDGRGVTHVDWSASGYVKLQDSNNNTLCTVGKLSPAAGGRAMVQDDGNLVFYRSNGSVAWASDTSGFAQGNTNYCYS